MPTYTYQCEACGHAFDTVQKFSDDPLTVCPECGGHIRRVIQPTPIVFKGSGWYINDSKSKSSTTSPAKTDTTATDKPAAEKKSSDTTTSSTESKPAASAASTTSSE